MLILPKSSSHETFEQRMKALGYEVIKGRGIAFMDQEKVCTKAIREGCSLSKIANPIDLITKGQSLLLKKYLKKTHSIDKNCPGRYTEKVFQNLLKSKFESDQMFCCRRKGEKRKEVYPFNSKL